MSKNMKRNMCPTTTNLKASKALKNQLGMTLIEIMIVIAIIGGLMAIVGSKLVGQLDNARIKNTKIQIQQLSKQLDAYYTDCNAYPTSDQGLEALLKSPGSDACSNWGPNPYLTKESELKDQWGHKFLYESDGTEYTIISYGRDGKEGGEGAAKDISSKDL
jgi:general secretion pathway protein G